MGKKKAEKVPVKILNNTDELDAIPNIVSVCEDLEKLTRSFRQGAARLSEKHGVTIEVDSAFKISKK
jgi:hypothetical protein